MKYEISRTRKIIAAKKSRHVASSNTQVLGNENVVIRNAADSLRTALGHR